MGAQQTSSNLKEGTSRGSSLSPFLFLLAVEGLNVLMKAVVTTELYLGYSIGHSDNTFVSHLPFDDDTLFLGTKSWVNVRSLKVVLMLFEMISGLKANLNKSMLVGVTVADS